ncbi:MAG: adenylate kinase [Acidimicrobiia bacterium]
MADPKPRIVLLGKQGAGKGTQATRVADHYGVAHLSTGDMFREQAALGTAFGLEAKRYMDAGELVPDEIVVGVVEECLAPGGPLGDGFVLDGFPRTVHQAEELDRVLGTHPLDVAINIDVPREIVLDRLAGRRVCENCQRVYHVNMPPLSDWSCDACGGKVVLRDDDTEEAIDRRLELYERETVPIIDHYRDHGLLEVVDGVGDGDEVYDRILKTVEDRLRSEPGGGATERRGPA